MDDNNNGYACLDCSQMFAANDARENEVSVLADSMYGRPAASIRQLEVSCPHCCSLNIEPAALCTRCHETPPETGSDYCAACDVIVEQEEHDAYMRVAREQRQMDLLNTLIDIARPVRVEA